jgi:hypothetical protein
LGKRIGKNGDILITGKKKSFMFLSTSIFTATACAPINGFIIVKGNKIEAVGTRYEAKSWIDKVDEVIDLGGRTVAPGFVDDHTFFTGYVLRSMGIDFSGIKSNVSGVSAIREYMSRNGSCEYIIGHGFDAENFSYSGEDVLSREFPDIPVAIFTADAGTCWMNEAARLKYGFTPQECYSEKLFRLMREYLHESCMKQKYKDYIKMLNSRGITAIKEIGYDDYSGFVSVLKDLEDSDSLNMRVSVLSQPVGEGINIDYGKEMREKLNGKCLSFEGYNRMTDRGIARFLGELIEPYAAKPGVTCLEPVDWELIEKETVEADKNGFRFALHCQGDGAVRHVVNIYEKCRKAGGKLINRHAITDLEYSNPADLERMGRLGVIAEIYPQIQSLDNKDDIMRMIETNLGGDRGKNYWNRRKMQDSGVCITCGTDLPLMLPDIPESVYCAAGGYFKDGKSYNVQNMLTVGELLTAWTKNGQYNCRREDVLGTLEAGKTADIVVLDSDIFRTPVKEIRGSKVCMTVFNGNIVYNNLH